MTILLLSNWSIHNGITRATIFPIIEALEKDVHVDRVIFCTLENEGSISIPCFNKTIHIPLKSNASGLFKLFSFLHLALKLRIILRTHRVNFVWCRGATAGGLGAIVNLLTGVVFVVDSFEPHAQYMVDSGTWRKGSLKFRIQNWLERLMLKKSRLLLPVSYKFHQCLLSKGLNSSNIFTFPCVVNLEIFKFRKEDRVRIRSSLQISSETVVGIYTGKYGGLYYEEEAFDLYRHAFNFWKNNFFLIILTEMDQLMILDQLKNRNIPEDRILIYKANHHEIPQYLSAADFAFSSIKSAQVMQYCSPIKHGEYWASDLPILTTLRFGDDAEIIQKEGGGIILDIFQEDMQSELKALQALISKGRTGFNSSLASKYRNPIMIGRAVQFIMTNLVTKTPDED